MKYRFEVYYATENMQRVNDFMHKCDLWPDTEACFKEVFMLTHKEDRDPEYIKGLLRQALEACACKVVDIVGGKYE